MSGIDSLLLTVLRRDRLALGASLVAVVALAWGWLLLGAGMDMTAVEMTRMSGMDGWLMQPATWSVGYAVLMFSMWWVMMVAMMLPSAAPMLLLYAQLNRKGGVGRSPLGSTTVFAAGYLVSWGGFSVVAVALQWSLETARLMSPMLEVTNVWLGAAILVAAGVWQFTPLKSLCLHQCRSPLAFLVANWRDGRQGALRMGFLHGAYCLGCCWFLMTLLFFGGVMNLAWIIGLAVFVLLEKTLPLGHWLGRLVGAVLVAWGVALLLP